MIAAILILSALAVTGALILVRAQKRYASNAEPLIAQINALLPQTQCEQCGYAGCLPYAQAIAEGEAINKCPPGGAAGIKKLAMLLDRELLEFDAERATKTEKRVAFIREDECIGCTLCIDACPVDAIVGAAKKMHTVIAAECTGCDLCVAPCPVDCIEMRPLPTLIRQWQWPKPEAQKIIPIKVLH